MTSSTSDRPAVQAPIASPRHQYRRPRPAPSPSPQPAAVAGASVRARRLAGLDGLRGLAALFVVLHHTYLMAFPGFPRNNGPLWAGWMIYGHFAVALFIVLSGFSLAVAPARNGWRIDSMRKFFFRRAWRILPTYWPALAFSLAVAWWITAQPGEGAPTLKSVAVNGLLLQDVIGAPSPNGAFWSIAVEFQLYFVFPLLILLVRRYGAVVMLSLLGGAVIAVGALAPHVSLVDKLMRFTPQFALLFGLGIVGAGVVRLRDRRLPFGWLALAAAAPMIAVIAVRGSSWTVTHLFWVDLGLGPAIVLLIASIASDRPRRLVSALDSRPLKSLGSFSYSLYLVHAPIVVAWYELVVAPSFGRGTGALVFALATGVPLAVVVARIFAAVFELPFTRHKSWPKLRAAMTARITGWRRREHVIVAGIQPTPAATQIEVS